MRPQMMVVPLALTALIVGVWAADPSSEVELVPPRNTNKERPGLFDGTLPFFVIHRSRPEFPFSGNPFRDLFFNSFPFSFGEVDDVKTGVDIADFFGSRESGEEKDEDKDKGNGDDEKEGSPKTCPLLCLLLGGLPTIPSFRPAPALLPKGVKPEVTVIEKELPDGTVIRTNRTRYVSEDGNVVFHSHTTTLVKEDGSDKVPSGAGAPGDGLNDEKEEKPVLESEVADEIFDNEVPDEKAQKDKVGVDEGLLDA